MLYNVTALNFYQSCDIYYQTALCIILLMTIENLYLLAFKNY